MKITGGKVIVCSPGRNFVTLKLETEDGVYGLGDATLNGRELAVASYLTDHVHAAARRARRATHRGHLAVPLQGRLLAARAGDDERDRGGRHGAVGHQGQGARRAGVSAARRRLARGGDGLRPRQRRHDRRDRGRARRATSRAATRRCARRPACRVCSQTYGDRQRRRRLRAGRARTRCRRRAWSSERYLRVRAAALRAAAQRARPERAPAARRPPSPDADRSRRGSAARSSRITCSGWRTRRRRRTRRGSG